MNPDGTAHSRVFKPRPIDKNELSVDVKSYTTAEVSIKDKSLYMLFELSVEHVNEVGLNVEHDPLLNQYPDADNPAHAVIVGIMDDDDIVPGLLAKKSKRVYV